MNDLARHGRRAAYRSTGGGETLGEFRSVEIQASFQKLTLVTIKAMANPNVA